MGSSKKAVTAVLIAIATLAGLANLTGYNLKDVIFSRRYDTLERIMSALRIPDHKQMIAVIGLGRMGKTGFEPIAPPAIWSCLSNSVEETLNFIWLKFGYPP